MKLIRADSEDALEMVRTTTENPAIQKGIEAVYALNADTILREQIRQRDKSIRDYDNDIASAKSEGIKEGMEKGMEKGKAEGRAEGKAEGRAEGRAEERSAIAETMRKNGFTKDQIKLALGNSDKD